MSALEPGLYRATVRGVADQIVMMHRNSACTAEDVADWIQHNIADITDARPLIVLDLENPAAVIRSLRKATENDWDLPYLDQVAASIEAQTKSPKPVEPKDLGAVVTASQVGECYGSDRAWVRFSHCSTDCWIDSLQHIRSWDDLGRVTL